MKEQLKAHIKKNSFLYYLVERLYWKINHIRARLFGTKLEEQRWADKRKLEILGYWEKKNHPRRHFLIEKIKTFAPLSRVLEVGCICGPNVYLLAKALPDITIKGIDINGLAITLGNELLKNEGIKNVALIEGKANDLSVFRENEFDLVFTDALLVYIGPDKIRAVLKECARVCRKGLVLAEWHIPNGTKELYDPHIGVWRRNYVTLLTELFPQNAISVSKTPAALWPDLNWQKFGYVIEVRL